jgi:hypothetical protein
MRIMIDRTEKTFGLKPKRLTADSAYGTGKVLAWLLGKNITPHIPVWERYERTDGMFPRAAFTYDAECNVYICPNGHPLRTSGTVHDGRVRNYLSQPGEGPSGRVHLQAGESPAARPFAQRAGNGADAHWRVPMDSSWPDPPIDSMRLDCENAWARPAGANGREKQDSRALSR